MEDQLIDLQTRLEFQDKAINDLNDIITDQQQQIDKLQRQVQMCNDKLDLLEASVDSGEGNETPPHY